jgi:hypothetical protein
MATDDTRFGIIDPLALSVQAAVRACGVGRTTLYAAMLTGELASCKVGKRRLILLEGLRAWLVQQRRDGRHPGLSAPISRSPIGAGNLTHRDRGENGR